MKSIFFILIVASSLIAGGSYEKTAETKETGHDSHASTATSVEMPAIPEVPPNAKVFLLISKTGKL
jgi:hypothetical protein